VTGRNWKLFILEGSRIAGTWHTTPRHGITAFRHPQGSRTAQGSTYEKSDRWKLSNAAVTGQRMSNG